MAIFSPYFKTSYIKSHYYIYKDVYIEAAKELYLPIVTFLKVLKPFHGITDSGLFWYNTYLKHHTNRLGMTQTSADPFFLFHLEEGELSVIIILQVDESLSVATKNFLVKEDE